MWQEDSVPIPPNKSLEDVLFYLTELETYYEKKVREIAQQRKNLQNFCLFPFPELTKDTNGVVTEDRSFGTSASIDECELKKDREAESIIYSRIESQSFSKERLELRNTNNFEDRSESVSFQKTQNDRSLLSDTTKIRVTKESQDEGKEPSLFLLQKNSIYQLVQSKMGCRLTAEFIALSVDIDEKIVLSILQKYDKQLWFSLGNGKVKTWTASIELLTNSENPLKGKISTIQQQISILEAKLPPHDFYREKGIVGAILDLIVSQKKLYNCTDIVNLLNKERARNKDSERDVSVKNIVFEILQLGNNFYWAIDEKGNLQLLEAVG